jgi:molecular chaperone DnaK (HSP70)
MEVCFKIRYFYGFALHGIVKELLTNIFTYKDRQIPTVLSYVDGDEYYGGQAKAFLVRNPDNTISSFRDFLGQEYATPNFT